MTEKLNLNLRLFDDGAAAPAADAGSAAENAAPATQQTPEEPADLRAEFDELVKGKYRNEFGRRMSAAIEGRVKNLKGYEQQAKQSAEVMQLVAQRYNLAADDYEGITNALLEDTAYLEDEAKEKGVTAGQLKEFRRLEYENEKLARQAREAEAQRQAEAAYSRWMNEAEELKALNPGFDLNAELDNPQFRTVLQVPGMSVKTAYMAVHGEDMIQSGMRYASQKAHENAANDIRARGVRPAENGTLSGAVQTHTDPSKFTSKELKEIADRVRRGERISF